MTDSPAERKRRSRAHLAGDHSLCLVGRCPDAPLLPASSRGGRLWAQLHDGLSPAQLVLLLEACRVVDRLDRLDAVLDGRDWLNFRTDDGVTDVTVTIDRALSEARQQALALKALVAELSRTAAAAPHLKAEGRVDAGIADLTARIAARRRPTSGPGSA